MPLLPAVSLGMGSVRKENNQRSDAEPRGAYQFSARRTRPTEQRFFPNVCKMLQSSGLRALKLQLPQEVGEQKSYPVYTLLKQKHLLYTVCRSSLACLYLHGGGALPTLYLHTPRSILRSSATKKLSHVRRGKKAQLFQLGYR